LPPHLYSVTT